MIRGLIFDFDGLILDSEPAVYQSWAELYLDYGCVLPLDRWKAIIGQGPSSRTFDPHTGLESAAGRPLDRAAVRAGRLERMTELLAPLPASPGVERYMSTAVALGLRLGVASSSSHAWVESHLARLGLRDRINAVACGDDVLATKPDPAVYRLVLDALALQPDEAIAFEDSPNGITAAKRAGLFCVAVPCALTADQPLDHADLRLTSLADLPLADLLALIAA